MAAYDEMVNGRGGVRAHWRGLLGVCATLGSWVLMERADRIARLVEMEDAGAGEPGWTCDPLPLPLAAAEFALLADGLAQRARLLEALLADLHGPQQVLASGTLPPALVFANPGFERACRGLPGPFLHAYAADLVRGPDGQWRVFADRPGGAPGIGFALAARHLVARVVPEVLQPGPIEPIRPFFQAWQEALAQRQPGFLAVLGASASGARWSGHAVLARALGCAVVELDDLVVHDAAVMLRTLSGLRRVDVLLRRVPTSSLDPLVTGEGTGLPGLFEVIRSGGIRILNCPGTELAEAPGLATFLPALCRALLGEPLRLATVPTLWLADQAARVTVRQSLRRWSVRPAMGTAPSVMLRDLPPGRRAALDAAIAARPWEWAASALVEPSEAPCTGAEGLTPRPVVLRLFLVCDGSVWRALPGGLARVLQDSEWPGEVMPAHATWKPVTVLQAQEPELSERPSSRVASSPARRAASEATCRVARDFYRFGCEVETLDALSRLGRLALDRAEGRSLPPHHGDIALLIACLSDAGIPAEDGIDEGLWQALQPEGALAEGAASLSRLAASLRDQFPAETYGLLRRVLNGLRHAVLTARPGADGISAALAAARRVSLLASGIAAEEMTRASRWRFLDLGRRLERARRGARLLARLLDRPAAQAQEALGLGLELEGLLGSYQSRFGAEVRTGPALELLAGDPENPRSIAFQLCRTAALLEVQAGADLAAEATRLAASISGTPALNGLAAGIEALSAAVVRRFLASAPAVTVVEPGAK